MIEKIADSILKQANVAKAREEISKAFKEDQDFFQGYIDNVGFLIEQSSEEDCYKIAEKVLKLIFGMEENKDDEHEEVLRETGM